MNDVCGFGNFRKYVECKSKSRKATRCSSREAVKANHHVLRCRATVTRIGDAASRGGCKAWVRGSSFKRLFEESGI